MIAILKIILYGHMQGYNLFAMEYNNPCFLIGDSHFIKRTNMKCRDGGR